jgi:AcrR family transcriptional regulator
MTRPADRPKWQRRKEARPSDIVAAALGVFGEKGFAGARLEEIAARAGVSKGTLYLYFETKADIFRAVVREAVTPNIEAVEATILGLDLPVADLLRLFLPRFAAMVTATPVGTVVKMVVGESRNFPELARVWHDDVVDKAISILATMIARAQAKGEIRPGDPRIHAFSIMGPMLMGVLWRETFTPVGAPAVDLSAIARQHADTVLEGLLVRENG